MCQEYYRTPSWNILILRDSLAIVYVIGRLGQFFPERGFEMIVPQKLLEVGFPPGIEIPKTTSASVCLWVGNIADDFLV